MPRAAKAAGKMRHDPLHQQLDEDELHAKYGKISKPGKRTKSSLKGDNEKERDGDILDPKISRRIFELARDQQEELGEWGDEDVAEPEDKLEFSIPRTQDLEDEDEDDLERFEHEDYLEEVEEIEVDEGDLQTLDALLPANAGERRTLADIIFSKLEDIESGKTTVIRRTSEENSDRAPDPAEGLNPKVVEMYTKVGLVLSRYKSGPLPKPFKIIPSLPAWARMLALTRPENWTPQACHAATRIFVSQMKPPQARVFLEGVLLDAIREDIRLTKEGARKNKNHRKLNVHYYESMRRALYKPAAFFKGIVFPLLNTGCTLQEAAIVASVLAKVKVPLLHSSAALIRLTNMEYSGPNSLFIRVLLDKKHALPYKVVDALVFHFIRLSNTYKARKAGEADKLPVLWHQSLLVFCQRYAADLTPDQKDALLDVVRANPHPQIGPEVRRELIASVTRGDPRPDVDGDVVMG
ncbi:hypothetical protein AcV5_000570 [Taiwanofungus camphoratus]|nr:hypothetical protein AcV5_000570 [Antrodia cinnamomea]